MGGRGSGWERLAGRSHLRAENGQRNKEKARRGGANDAG
jgi:hypothetical protein